MWSVAAMVLAFIFGGFWLPHLYVSIFCRSQNLKEKYKAKWALVTGASSGIGKALATQLAAQGLNVVLVALDDAVLDNTYLELKSQFKKIEFIKVGANLGSAESGYMEKLAKATEKLDIQIVFCNAGYMLTGFFHKTTSEAQCMNMECNAGSAVKITHLFLTRMLQKKRKGCIVFTSSAAAIMPSPFSVMYASTKAFISSFGASLAAEVKAKGVDVCVIHPSPVASNFYDKAHKLGALEFFKKFSVAPDALPDLMFGAIGRCVHRDIGAVAVAFRMLVKVMDFGLLAWITASTAHTMEDYKKHA